MLIMRRLGLGNTRGDTIVEVLVSIAVVSLVLGAAFVATNRSLQSTRAAQERGDALKLIESQVEQLKALSSSDPDEIFGTSTPASFCIDDSTSQAFASTHANCKVNAAGINTTTEPAYTIAITRTGNTFTLTNIWASQNRGSDHRLVMKYRVYD